MKKISVVVPCYNAEKTIERCADSLLGQTIGREELELIFVNDGSTDDTYAKLLQIEAEYPEGVLIINLEQNGGQGAARNAGMSYAGGEYLGFLDADDFIEPDMYEKLYHYAKLYDCTMSGGGYILDKDMGAAGKKPVSDSLPLETCVTVDTMEKRKQLILSGTSVTFAGRIYRLDLIRERGITFLEGMLYEDNYWQSLMNIEIERYYICKECFYHYVERADSSTKRMTERNFLQSMQMQVMLMEEYGRRGLYEPLFTELQAKFLKSHTIMNLLGMYLEWKEIPEQIYRKMQEDIARYAPDRRDNPYLWKADRGLLEDMFSETLDDRDRKSCMEQYKRLLEQGRIGEWKPVFRKRREEKWRAFEEKCFALAQNSEELQKTGNFMEMADALLKEADHMGRFREGTAYLEQMLSRGETYYKRLEKVSPILIYKGDAICYNVLNDFACRLIVALRAAGEQVEIYDEGESGAEGLLELCGKTYKAIVGFQTYLFGVRFQSGENVHDKIHGPKLHFIFDHPLWMKEHLEQGPKDYYILTHGRDYKEFVERYFAKEIKKCYLLPPAGIAEDFSGTKEKSMDVTFVGTWYDYRERLAFIKNTRTKERYLANRFLLIMKRNPNLRAEEAFTQALADYGITLETEAFKSVLFDMKQVCFAVMTYYREKVIRILLQQGITVHVYGESWKKSPLAADANLVCHEAATIEESLHVWRSSKISLNIMSWHKGGFTERIANMLLCGTVAVSDKSWYLEEHFTDGKDIVLFDLEKPERLAERIKYLLVHEEKRKKIAAAGRKKALAEHTWEVRASQLLQIIDEL